MRGRRFEFVFWRGGGGGAGGFGEALVRAIFSKDKPLHDIFSSLSVAVFF